MRNSTEAKQIKDFNSDLKSVEIMLQPQPETRHVRLDTNEGSNQSLCNSFEASSTNSSANKHSIVIVETRSKMDLTRTTISDQAQGQVVEF